MRPGSIGPTIEPSHGAPAASPSGQRSVALPCGLTSFFFLFLFFFFVVNYNRWISESVPFSVVSVRLMDSFPLFCFLQLYRYASQLEPSSGEYRSESPQLEPTETVIDSPGDKFLSGLQLQAQL